MIKKALLDELEELIGENHEDEGVRRWLSTNYPPLNKIISGSYDKGVPYGRIIDIHGPSSSGKTAIATAIMIEAQRAGGVAMFMDHEHSFDPGMAEKMGLKRERPWWIYLKPKTWEESNTTVLKAAQLIREKELVPADAPIVAVFDSVAAMIPKSVFEKGIDEYSMNDTTALARVTSTTLKAVKAVVAELGITAIYLNQVRMKPGVVYGDPTTTPGGSALEFYADVRISLGRTKLVEKEGAEKVFVGQEISAKTVKNKFTRPFQTTKWKFMFREDGSGYFDVIGSLIDHLLEIGALEQSGARINWVDGKSYFPKALATKIEKDGELDKLIALLPRS